MNPDLPDNVIKQQLLSVIADLMGVMEHIITEGEERKHTKVKSNIEMCKANSSDLLKVLKDGENWNLCLPSSE